MFKKTKFKFSLTNDNIKSKKLNLYGASYSILLDNLLTREESKKIHGRNIFSLSPLYIDLNKNIAEMYVSTWNEEGIKLLNNIRDRLIFDNKIFNFDFIGKEIRFKFDSYQECSNDCFGVRIEDINNVPFSEVKDVEMFINTPFFIKLGNKNFCYPDLNVIFNCLKKNQTKIEGNAEEIEIKNLFPVNFSLNSKTGRYCGVDLYGCVGYIKFDIQNLMLKEKEVILRQLIYSTYTGIGAKTAHGFGNIAIKINGKTLREFIGG